MIFCSHFFQKALSWVHVLKNKDKTCKLPLKLWHTDFCHHSFTTFCYRVWNINKITWLVKYHHHLLIFPKTVSWWLLTITRKLQMHSLFTAHNQYHLLISSAPLWIAALSWLRGLCVPGIPGAMLLGGFCHLVVCPITSWPWVRDQTLSHLEDPYRTLTRPREQFTLSGIRLPGHHFGARTWEVTRGRASGDLP